MLPEIIVISSVMLIALIYAALHFSKKGYGGSNPYLSFLLSFLISGMGIAYIGFPIKGLIWYLIQLIAVFIAHMISQRITIEEKYLGLIIMLPFFVQLFVTAIELNKKRDDVNW